MFQFYYHNKTRWQLTVVILPIGILIEVCETSNKTIRASYNYKLHLLLKITKLHIYKLWHIANCSNIIGASWLAFFSTVQKQNN